MEQQATANELYLTIWQHLHANQHKLAYKLLDKLSQLAPQWSETYFTRAYIALLAKSYPLAFENFQKILLQKPQHLTALAGKALCLLHLGEFTGSLLIAKKLLQEEHNDPIYWHMLSELFHASGELDSYLSCCQKLTALIPNNANMLANLSEALRYTGDYLESEKIVNKALTLAPGNATMLYNRSHIRKQSKDKNHIEQLKTILSKQLSQQHEMQLCYALAKELEDIGEYQQAFDYLKRGSQLRRNSSNYNVASDIATMRHIQKTFSSDKFDTFTAGYETEEPLFIMGLPRTGTTLLERIIASHTDVFAAGELQNFSGVLIKALSQQNPGIKLNKQLSVDLACKLNWQALGQSYLASTRPRTGHSKHFIDKMPINYLYLGLIAQALPQAKIILVQRHPLDACYAIYKTLFAQVYPYSYCLQDLGHYYVAWYKLMTHWQQCRPDNLITVNYEDLVHDTQATTSELLQFCKLPWQQQCLDFHSLKTGVATASASQVRQPIYNSSIGKWKHVENELAPLIDILNKANIPF
ncbi:sulfotransferase [Dasania sp. GY-MA-18]|uniref:Sulfotransferase n=1 Tax=Dasania phycosphaerae TaxID=2950436 RepID=A0A9J6RRF9_9GAMM|nr:MULTISPECIES: tetratricopeptide repeat-containing sulfotransferase family protein [Dasania]MCR8924080.1 sulfotransferase [Dasania sp. GY-MA-18]MCZ0866653.1 sulfotransferase [Dasania phycosphaerae]MCZ0870238.1 sulfotransferase [Dasania phycosphaerae]